MRTNPSIDRRIVSQRLCTARTSKRFTGEKVAELCGISPSYYRQLESGHKNFSLSILVKLCKALDVSPDYLLGYSYQQPDMLSKVTLTPQHQALIQDITHLLEERLSAEDK